MDIASPNTEEVTTARWFVMRAYKSEKRAEEKLKGKDGLEYFIPKCYAVRVYHGVKSKRLVPVIPNLVFVHASRTQITEFKKRYNVTDISHRLLIIAISHHQEFATRYLPK